MEYPRLIIGWQEWVSLPELSIPAVCAKIDTGAKTSSIHAYQIECFTEKGKDFVRFEVHPIVRNSTIIRQCEMPLFDKRSVKSSNGETEERPVVKTLLHIDGNEWEIELNLTNRDYMGSRMLIGREALRKHTLVHSGVKYIHGKISDKAAKKKYLEKNNENWNTIKKP
jgi:ribosomal protein S6--L-glutamate ligase